jgi:hypothetical protein
MMSQTMLTKMADLKSFQYLLHHLKQLVVEIAEDLHPQLALQIRHFRQHRLRHHHLQEEELCHQS